MRLQTTVATHPRPQRPREGFVLRPPGSQIDLRCDRRSRSHRPPASSSPGFQSRAENAGQIMPRERCLINLLLRVVALLFRVEARAGSMASQASCPAGRTGRYHPIVDQRGHLRLIRDGFAERLLSELTGEESAWHFRLTMVRKPATIWLGRYRLAVSEPCCLQRWCYSPGISPRRCF